MVVEWALKHFLEYTRQEQDTYGNTCFYDLDNNFTLGCKCELEPLEVFRLKRKDSTNENC